MSSAIRSAAKIRTPHSSATAQLGFDFRLDRRDGCGPDDGDDGGTSGGSLPEVDGGNPVDGDSGLGNRLTGGSLSCSSALTLAVTAQ